MTGPRFRRWIRRQPVAPLLLRFNRSGLSISRQAIYHWRNGRSAPASLRLPIIMKIAGSSLTIRDVAPRRAIIRRRGR